jgi:hypothetical protein
MAWVDTDYIDGFIGERQREKLFSDSAGVYDADVFAQYELGARATVLAVMQYAGYPDPGDTLTAGLPSTGLLSKLIGAIMVRDAYSTRRGVRLSQEATDAIGTSLSMLDAIYNKKLPIPGMAPQSAQGYGGVQFSPTSPYSTGARRQVFVTLRGSGF